MVPDTGTTTRCTNRQYVGDKILPQWTCRPRLSRRAWEIPKNITRYRMHMLPRFTRCSSANPLFSTPGDSSHGFQYSICCYVLYEESLELSFLCSVWSTSTETNLASTTRSRASVAILHEVHLVETVLGVLCFSFANKPFLFSFYYCLIKQISCYSQVP